MPVKQVYETTKGSQWDSYNKAIIAEGIETSECYMESWRVKELVTHLDTKFVILPKAEPIPATAETAQIIYKDSIPL